MPALEIYTKPGFGRRIRVVTAAAAASLRHLYANLFTSIPGYGTAPVAPAPVAPAVTVSPAVTGTTNVGDTLTCTDGTWTGTAPITYSYQWKQDPGGVDIPGATGATYVLQASDQGKDVFCRVTAHNAAGNQGDNSNKVSVP